MIQVRDVLGRARPLAVAAVFTAVAFLPIAATHFASAGAIKNRSLLVTSSIPSDSTAINSAAQPGTAASAKVGHTYKFTADADYQLESLGFGAYDSAFGYTAGYTSSTSLASGTGFGVTNAFAGVTVQVNADPADTTFVFERTGTNSKWNLKSATGVAVTEGDEVTVTFPASATNYFTNPNNAFKNGATQGTYFVHIWAYSDDMITVEDEGTVTSAVATAIDVETRVQETLKFSVEGDMRDGVAGNGGTPTSGTGAFNGPTDASTTCAPLTGKGSIKIGDLANNALAANTTYNGKSYFRLATNSARGAKVLYSAAPLKSGTEYIGVDGSSGNESETFTSTLNSEQFGFAFSQTDIDLSDLSPLTGYDNIVANEFSFHVTEDIGGAPVVNAAPTPIAESTGTVSCDTGALEYFANIAEDTAAGIYTTRITYIASPSY